ncbi:MAG: PAS domain-containing protein, partial [Syntrophotalea acetylenica]|nr:PAS domain-containing protein [Syntrophotalea acetylenica]
LATREAQYRTLVESQVDLICRWRPDTTLTFVNAAYCRFFGKTREQLIGAKFLDITPRGCALPSRLMPCRRWKTRV